MPILFIFIQSKYGFYFWKDHSVFSIFYGKRRQDLNDEGSDLEQFVLRKKFFVAGVMMLGLIVSLYVLVILLILKF